MRSRLHNLSKWQYLPEGDALHYANDRRRTVILEVNSPGEVCYYVLQPSDQVSENPEWKDDEAAGRARADRRTRPVVDADGESPGGVLQFVGVCKGRGTIEFAVDGAFDLVAEGGGAYVYSNDGLQVETRVIAPVIFTRIANRRQRNPHLEMIEFQMRLNQERFLQELEAEQSRRLEALERRVERYAPQRNQDAAAAIARVKARAEGQGLPGRPDEGSQEGAADAGEGGPGGPVPSGEPAADPAADVRGKARKARGSGLPPE